VIYKHKPERPDAEGSGRSPVKVELHRHMGYWHLTAGRWQVIWHGWPFVFGRAYLANEIAPIYKRCWNLGPIEVRQFVGAKEGDGDGD
jgi:hypothetical protein